MPVFEFESFSSFRLTIRRTRDRASYTREMTQSHHALQPELYGHLKSLTPHASQTLFDLVETNSQKRVGGISLHNYSEVERKLEMGYWIHPDFGRQGLASEAVQAMIVRIFRNRKIKKLVLRCNSLNRPSLRLAERLGFQREAVWTGFDPTLQASVRMYLLARYDARGLGRSQARSLESAGL